MIIRPDKRHIVCRNFIVHLLFCCIRQNGYCSCDIYFQQTAAFWSGIIIPTFRHFTADWLTVQRQIDCIQTTKCSHVNQTKQVSKPIRTASGLTIVIMAVDSFIVSEVKLVESS